MDRNNQEITIPFNPFRQWMWIVTFAIAFAWVESAVVVYLRDIFFEGGFRFPLYVKWEGDKHIISPLVRIEFIREIATIIMLVSAGWAVGKNRIQRFCFFMIAFGIWDIFYYIFLWIMIRWPESLMTWDLLFFVPLPWVGPVITPVMIAVAMSVGGTLIIYLGERGARIRFRWYDAAVEGLFVIVMIAAFCWDYKNILQIPGEASHTGIPNDFAWWLYLPAFIFSLLYCGIRLWHMVRITDPSRE